MAVAVVSARPASRGEPILQCLAFLPSSQCDFVAGSTSPYQVPFEEKASEYLKLPVSADEVLDVASMHSCAHCGGTDVKFPLIEPFPSSEHYWAALRYCPDCPGDARFSMKFITNESVRRLEAGPANVIRLDRRARLAARAA